MAGQSGSQVGSRDINRAILGSIALSIIRRYVICPWRRPPTQKTVVSARHQYFAFARPTEPLLEFA
jgi:hypothetical protein